MARRGRPSRKDVLTALDRAVGDLSAVGGLPHPTEAESIWEGIWYEETHHSTAIEGNTLVLKQVRQLLEEGRAVGNKELREYLEVQGYAEAARWVYRQAVQQPALWEEQETLTLTEIREVHRLVVGPAWQHFPPEALTADDGPGAFRRVDINPFASGMRPPPFTDVPPQMTDWIAAATALPPPEAHPMEHLADLHARFERIHPFGDGNGRTGRLLLNLLLVRHGYPPAIIYKRDRSRYLTALQRADAGDLGALAELLARSVTDGIHRFLLPALAGPHRIVPLSSLVTRDISQVALAQAAKRGRLRAVHQNGQWYSSRIWLDEYLASRWQRRPPNGSL